MYILIQTVNHFPFQSAMWKIYEQKLHEWESTVCRIQGSSNGYQEKNLPPKPALFAFCLKPRGLHVPHKGPKQRSHKRLMSTGCHSFSRENDGFYRQGILAGYKSNDCLVFSCLLMCIALDQFQAGNTMNALGMGG